MNQVIHQEALDRIKRIHKLSQKYNQKGGKTHREKLLELSRKHVDEIKELYTQSDPHAIIETGDLLVLCLELLIESGASVDEVMVKCFKRYEEKLTSLIEGEKG